MKRIAILMLLLSAMAGGLGAQTPPGPSSAPEHSQALPAGITIPVELSKALDAKKAKVNDRLEARIPADVLSHGKIVVPRGSKVTGHVTEVKAHSKESVDSRLGIVFDRIVMKEGKEAALPLVVQALARPLQLVVADTRMGDEGGASSGTLPSRSPERVAAIPIDAGSDSDGPPPATVAPLAATSQGVVGMKGLSLKASGGSSVISSEKDNVRLESGTQMILRVE